MKVPLVAPFCARGLVLLEMLAAVCVLGVLAAMAVPGISAISDRLKLNATAESLVSSLYAARAQAYQRGGHVTVSQNASPDCAPAQDSSNWGCGWMVFADADEDGVRDSGDELILVEQAPRGIEISQTNRLAALRLNAWGQFTGNRGTGFVVRLRGRTELATAICMSSGGRIRSQPGANECS